jgi:hypothetical protein
VRRDEGEFQELAPYASGALATRRGRGRGSIARVESGVPGIRPRRVGEVLDVATEVFRARFGTYVGLSTLLWLPVYVVQSFLVVAEWTPGDVPFQTAGFFLGFLVTLFATGVVSVLDNAIVARLVADELAGRGVSIGDAVKNALSRGFAISVIAFVNSTLTTFGCFCMILPGILIAWQLYLAPAICVIEDAGIGESFARSSHLARGRLGPWLGLFVVAFLLLLPFTLVAGVSDRPDLRATALGSLGIPALAYDCARIGFASLFTGVATAFQAVVATVWYFDSRARREGIDLEARLERLVRVTE